VKTLPGSGAGDTAVGVAESGEVLLGTVAQPLTAAATHASAIINRVQALIGRLKGRD
jgi:hypothetical protein